MTKDEEEGPLKKMGEVLPEFPIKLQKSDPIENDDNFGPEDVIWTGGELDEAGNAPVDPDLIIAEHGQDPYPPLRYLMLMLAGGQSPDLDQDEIHRRARKAYFAIVGNAPRRAPRNHRYNEIRHEIAWQVYVALYDNHFSEEGVDIPAIIRKLVRKHLKQLIIEKNRSEDNLVKSLHCDLIKNFDLYLVRATSDDDYNRMNVWRALKTAAASLERAGISIKIDVARPNRLAKNQRRADRGH